jgi:uncharacterized protein (DUF433 family)
LTTDTLIHRIVRTPGICGGKACIAGHRVRVMDVALLHERAGMSADEIVAQFPGLSMSDVHTALAYYFDHRDEIQEEMRADAVAAERLRDRHPSKLKRQRTRGAG